MGERKHSDLVLLLYGNLLVGRRLEGAKSMHSVSLLKIPYLSLGVLRSTERELVVLLTI